MGPVELRDGTRVLIRPIEPDDREAVVRGFEKLSAQSRYRRFFAPMAELSQRDLDYLTNVDHHDHEALVAVAADSGEGIGVARYVRTGRDTAEPAMVVVDEWQGRGVGGHLLTALAARAREEGIAVFDAPVLATNRDAIRALARLGSTVVTPEGPEVELRIELDAIPAARPGGRPVLPAFATGLLEPARTVLDLFWPRRRGAADEPRRNVVVVGTDGSDHARAAVEAAAAIAGATGARLDVVGVHRFLVPERDEVGAEVRRAGEELRARGLRVHEHLRRGDPALVLVEVAADEDARLLVVGFGGRGSALRRLIGATADAVAERAPCDVLLVRPPAAGPNAG